MDQYTHTGDINIGILDDEEKVMLFNTMKNLCKAGLRASIKYSTSNLYYLSVPVYIPCVHDVQDRLNPYIYAHPLIENKKFYFEDLEVPDSITCITFNTTTNKFISNKKVDGCDQEIFEFDASFYEIYPVNLSYKTQEEKIQKTKSSILYPNTIYI